MQLDFRGEVQKPPKDSLHFIDILTRMNLMCAKDNYRNHHEMFTIGFLFSKFKMTRFEDLEFLYNCFSMLPNLINDGLISQSQKYMILDRMVITKNAMNKPDSFEVEINTYIEQCVNDTLNNTNTFNQTVIQPMVPIVEEDPSEKYIREMLQADKVDIFEEYPDKNCPICLEQINYKDLGLLQCTHAFHRSCLCESFKNDIDNRKFPIKCPAAQCRVEALSSDVVEFIPQSYVTKFQNYTFQSYVNIHNEDMSWCPTAGCKYVFYFKEGDREFACPVCLKVYCLNCKADSHNGMTCRQFGISRVYDKNDEKFIDFVRGAKYKQCPKCKFWVEKNMGCDHMRCRCKFEFCYVCGGVYKNCACNGAPKIEVFVPGRQSPIELSQPVRPLSMLYANPPLLQKK